jgi:signal transduction histidine kinase
VLDEFIDSHRDLIIERARSRVASRASPRPKTHELVQGIPLFLTQLSEALRLAKVSDAIEHRQIGESASRHGAELLRMGLSIGQVVHDYGSVCQTVTALAIELDAPISGEEFRTLNLCLDDAIAGAVTEYSRERVQGIEREGAERLGTLAHEIRNLVNTASLSFESITSGHVASGGSTAAVLKRSLIGLRNLVDRSLSDVRLDAELKTFETISVADLVEEVEIGAMFEAEARPVKLTVATVDPALSVKGDRQILAAALSNLLQNAFKFTPPDGAVSLTAYATSQRILFDVQDSCGGLPAGSAQTLFQPFIQRGVDRSGVGLGLAICMKAAQANGGEIRVRDLPGQGCVFTLDLPQLSA